MKLTLLIILSLIIIYYILRVVTVIHLIRVYNKAIKELPENPKEAIDYLEDRNLQLGICNYLNFHLFYLVFSLWLEKYNPKVAVCYWFQVPVEAYRFDWLDNTVIKSTLILRRDRLKYILKRLTIFK